MIVKNVANILPDCIYSVQDYVDEIIIVDTGSTDKTIDVAFGFTDKVINFSPKEYPEDFLMDNEISGVPGPFTDKLYFANFARARNISFQNATSDYVLWLDADDILMGADHIPYLLERMEKEGRNYAELEYHCYFDNLGEPTNVFLRPRIFARKSNPKWNYEVHESPCCDDFSDSKKITDKRIYIEQRNEWHSDKHNLIQHYKFKINYNKYLKGEADSRILFYLGNEAKCFNTEMAIKFFNEYLLVSYFNEEKSLAHYYLGCIYENKATNNEGKNYFIDAFREFAASSTTYLNNPEAWFGMARIAYFLQHWDDCIRFTEIGFKRKIDGRCLFYDKKDISFKPHLYLNVALIYTQRYTDALESCNKGLQIIPDNKMLLDNKKFIENKLGV
jgi:glycosyltransferase involved in cell wall biosynthesis